MNSAADGESGSEHAIVEPLLAFYESQAESLEHGKNSLESLLMTSRDLAPYRHSVRLRIKSSTSMRGKLVRKLRRSVRDDAEFPVTTGNFFTLINDSIGVRLLHLSVMSEFAAIHAALMALFERESIVPLEKPKAFTWDPEYVKFFTELGLHAELNDRFYTSVHYVVAPNKTVPWSAEIQVRTLAEELWGEVDHRLNYPKKHDVRACRDQILALARSVGGCSRLVDSIFQTDVDHRAAKRSKPKPAEKRKSVGEKRPKAASKGKRAKSSKKNRQGKKRNKKVAGKRVARR